MQLPVSTYDLDNPASTSRLVNCYAEPLPQGARSPVILQRCPGMEDTSTADARIIGKPIALKKFPKSDFLVAIFSDGELSLLRAQDQAITLTTVAPLALDIPANEYIDVACDADSMVFVVEPNAYRVTWSGGNTDADTPNISVTQINDADFTARGAGDVEFLDNYFLFREPGTARFFGSDVGAPTSYTSTSFATAEAQGDNLVGMKATNANLALFGEETLELWDAVGGSGFPFRRIINGAIDKGCFNGRTIALIDDQLFWVADDRTVRSLVGMQPQKVSTFAIDKYLQEDDGLMAARGFTYTWGGHNYYVLKLSSRCFVYDITTGQWHERKTLGMPGWAFGSSETAFGSTYFGRTDSPWPYYKDGTYPIYRINEDVYYETKPRSSSSQGSAVPMVMEWTYQPVWGNGQRVFHDRLEIVIQTGVGNSDATDPVIMLEASDDGGETWFSFANRSMGAQGKTFQRVVWNNLGSSYQRVYRASVSDPVPVRVMSTELAARGGSV